jgi:hypothetical protein
MSYEILKVNFIMEEITTNGIFINFLILDGYQKLSDASV